MDLERPTQRKILKGLQTIVNGRADVDASAVVVEVLEFVETMKREIVDAAPPADATDSVDAERVDEAGRDRQERKGRTRKE
jgi:hypothetical protein